MDVAADLDLSDLLRGEARGLDVLPAVARVPELPGRVALLPRLRRGEALAHAERRLRDLVTKYFAKLCKILQIFGGLVLGCIKTRFYKKICV